MKRTSEEIRQAIYDACGGDWIDSNNKIAALQGELIGALIWAECPPEGGWSAVFDRQMAALRAMPADANADEKDKPFSWLAPAPSPTPADVMKDVSESYWASKPWDIGAIDYYISNGGKFEE